MFKDNKLCHSEEGDSSPKEPYDCGRLQCCTWELSRCTLLRASHLLHLRFG